MDLHYKVTGNSQFFINKKYKLTLIAYFSRRAHFHHWFLYCIFLILIQIQSKLKNRVGHLCETCAKLRWWPRSSPSYILREKWANAFDARQKKDILPCSCSRPGIGLSFCKKIKKNKSNHQQREMHFMQLNFKWESWAFIEMCFKNIFDYVRYTLLGSIRFAGTS